MVAAAIVTLSSNPTPTGRVKQMAGVNLAVTTTDPVNLGYAEP